MGHAASQAHMNGDCWPSQCQACIAEDADATYGMCTACGAIEVALHSVSGFRDLSAIGEHERYPVGYGCEMCS